MDKLILVPIYALIAVFTRVALFISFMMEVLLAVLIIASSVVVIRIIVKEMHLKH